MAIDTTNSYQEFTADGQTAYFAFDFNYVDASEIVVGKRTGDNAYETVAPEYYQVIQNAAVNGGQVRFISNPSGSEIVDNPVPAGTIVRIERRSPETSNATWQIGLEMTEMIALFDTLFRLVQENAGRFDNTIETFATQHGVKLYELLAKHTDKLFYWDDEKKTITPTDFPRQDVVRSVGGLFFRIKVDESTNTPYLEWSKNGIDDWFAINLGAITAQVSEVQEKAEQAIESANNANAKADELDKNKADKTALTETESKVLAETNRAKASENQLQTNINNVSSAVATETSRAQAAESNLQTNIDTVSSAVASETTRAQNAEKELSDSIVQLESELTAKASASELQTVKNDLGDLGDQVSNIEEKIPANATAQNQLATKADIQAAGGLSEVVHDDTLSGQGTSSSPLKVVGGGLPAGGLAGQILAKTDTGETWTDEAGLEGDYCSRYGIVDETKSGLPTIVSGSTVKIPAQLVMDIPGVPGLTTNGSAINYEIKSTINCALFFANGEILEATDVFFQKSEPEDGTTGYAAWWNGTEWKFKSNDTGNVYRPANAVRIAKCIFTNGSLTRLCFTGCRLLNKQEYATKEDIAPAVIIREW